MLIAVFGATLGLIIADAVMLVELNVASSYGLPLVLSAVTETKALLKKAQLDHDRLAQGLDGIRRLPPRDQTDLFKRSKGLAGVLETVKLQLQKTLGAIFARDGPLGDVVRPGAKRLLPGPPGSP